MLGIKVYNQMRNTNLGLRLTLILLPNLSLSIKAGMCWLGQVAGTWHLHLATSPQLLNQKKKATA
jgi:hypothetical protein|tara:strand:+ start:166 stop:360 length:195 start_codon:yes stop_codon:yes gene_type:complete